MKVITVRPDGSRRVVTRNTEPSLTDQSQAKACDVNQIMIRYKKTGQVTHLAKNQGVYADVSEIPDLTEALNKVSAATAAFETVPAYIRKLVDNDPVKFIEFLQNPQNDDLAIKLGLKVAKQKPSDTVPSVEEQPKTDEVKK